MHYLKINQYNIYYSNSDTTKTKDTHSWPASTRRTRRTCKTPIPHQKPQIPHTQAHNRNSRLKLTTWNRRLSWPWSGNRSETLEWRTRFSYTHLRTEMLESESGIQIGSLTNGFKSGPIIQTPEQQRRRSDRMRFRSERSWKSWGSEVQTWSNAEGDLYRDGTLTGFDAVTSQR